MHLRLIGPSILRNVDMQDESFALLCIRRWGGAFTLISVRSYLIVVSSNLLGNMSDSL